MKRLHSMSLACVSLVALFVVAETPNTPRGISWFSEAGAIIGRPLSPVSFAGVARRTTRRAVVVGSEAAAASAYQQQAVTQQPAAAPQPQAQPPATGAPPIGSVVSTLPAGCVSKPKGGVQYFDCKGVYYRAAFQGSNLVYVVTQP